MIHSDEFFQWGLLDEAITALGLKEIRFELRCTPDNHAGVWLCDSKHVHLSFGLDSTHLRALEVTMHGLLLALMVARSEEPTEKGRCVVDAPNILRYLEKAIVDLRGFLVERRPSLMEVFDNVVVTARKISSRYEKKEEVEEVQRMTMLFGRFGAGEA